MHTFLTFTWALDNGLDLGFFTLRYYSLLFAVGFILGFQVMKKIFKAEKTPLDQLDQLLTYMVISTVVGARLGHVFFYQWDYYSQHPVEIFKVWEGGLASHGAAIAIILGLIIYSKKVSKKSVLWILDRVVITVALAGAFIRFGNFTNSEIYGKMANSSIETVFIQPTEQSFLGYLGDNLSEVEFSKTENQLITDSLIYPEYKVTLTLSDQADIDATSRVIDSKIKKLISLEDNDNLNFFFLEDRNNEIVNNKTIVTYGYGVPRYPTQLIESFGYLLIFILLFLQFWKTDVKNQLGSLFGQFLITVFGFRFFVEYLKANQVAFESNMDLNMGQWLSIPLVLLGLFFILKPLLNKNKS